MLRDLVDERKLERLPLEVRDEVIQALRELEYHDSQQPIFTYFPHAKQKAFHAFTTKIKFFSGGVQSGKTTAGLADDVIQALNEEDLPSHLRPFKKFEPPFLCRIMGPSFGTIATVIFEKLGELIPPHTLLGGKWSTAFDRQLSVLHFQNGSRFSFMSYDQETLKMRGASLDRVHFDEEPYWEVWNENKARVMARSGDLIFTQTPSEGLSWSFDGIWNKAVRKEHEVAEDVWIVDDISVVRVDMDDNPTLKPEQIRLTLDGMSKEEQKSRKEGRYVALHGLIYPDYSTDHLIPEISEVPENVNVVIGIDPGIRNQTGVLWAYLGADDCLVFFQEGYYEDHTAAMVAREIHATNAELGVNPLYYVIDPAARNKEHATGRSVQMEYMDHGIVTIAGQHDVRPGINRVKERFERKAADGTPNGIRITANCRNFIHELERYRWRSPPPRSPDDAPEKPVKRADHLMDAMRYIVMSRPYLPEVQEVDSETPLQKAMREDIEGTNRSDVQDHTGDGVFA